MRDDKGDARTVPPHIEIMCELMQDERLLDLLAARDHGKTWTVWDYIGWRIWKHNRNPDGTLKPGNPDGNFDFMYFTATMPLAIERFERIEQLLLDNAHLFGDILPRREPGMPLATLKDQWAKTKFRLRNGAGGVPKSIGSSYRGPHPQLIVADDIVTPENSTTELQRGRVWQYLVSTIMPMAGTTGQLIVIGTPQHKQDALFRLKGKPEWRWVKMKALNDDTGAVLWAARYSRQALLNIRATDPLLFSREYQMDPREDAASIFPLTLTAYAIQHDGYDGTMFSFLPVYPPQVRSAGEFVVLGGDLAISESVGADFTVIKIVAYNRYTQKRRLLFASRLRGLTFDQQVSQLRDLARRYAIDLGVIEQNTFQKWLHQTLARYPETAMRIFGHTTGVEKQNLVDGIPGMKIVLENHLWEVPYSEKDPSAREYVDIWRSELQAFGWAEGKLQGVGEHDDTVLATWMVERAIRIIEAHRPQEDDLVTAEEVGIEPVRIGNY